MNTWNIPNRILNNIDIVYKILGDRIGHNKFFIQKVDESETIKNLYMISVYKTHKPHQIPETYNIIYSDIRNYKIEALLGKA
jgi:hypothetical protein